MHVMNPPKIGYRSRRLTDVAGGGFGSVELLVKLTAWGCDEAGQPDNRECTRRLRKRAMVPEFMPIAFNQQTSQQRKGCGGTSIRKLRVNGLPSAPTTRISAR
jgi:hypothetical protein